MELHYAIIALWFVALGIILWHVWVRRAPSAGIALSYWCNLAMIHLIGEVTETYTNYLSPDRRLTIQGFQITGFAIGGFLLGWLVLPMVLFRTTRQKPQEKPAYSFNQALKVYVIGMFAFFVGLIIFRAIPGMRAILGGGLGVACCGLCWWWLGQYRERRLSAHLLVAAIAVLFPILTVVTQGFLGYGVVAFLSFTSFAAVYYRPRWQTLAIAPFALYLALSLYITYINDRAVIRRTVWSDQDLADRFDVVAQTVGRKWIWFDPSDYKHIALIDARLNQNVLIGYAQMYIGGGAAAYADGETLIDSLIALVPRALWPDKPVFAGSGILVSRFTGLRFDENTAVGIGHILEFYVNFGGWGVFLGSTVIGLMMYVWDRNAGLAVRRGDFGSFLLWFATGQTMLNVGGVFAESTAGAVGCALFCFGINRVLSAMSMAPPSPRAPTREPAAAP